MEAGSSCLRSLKTSKQPLRVTFMPSPRRKRSLGSNSSGGCSIGSPKKTCVERKLNVSSRFDKINMAFVTSRRETNRTSSINSKKVTSLSKASISSRPNPEILSNSGKVFLGTRSNSTNRLGRTDQLAQKEFFEKLNHLEKQLQTHIESSDSAMEVLRQKNEDLTNQTSILQQRLDTIERDKNPESILPAIDEEDFDKLKNRSRQRDLELKTLQQNYEVLKHDYISIQRLLDVKNAENLMLEDLLEIEKEKSRKSDDELEIAVQENHVIRKKMHEYESRMVTLHNEVLELKGNIRVFVRVRPSPFEELDSCLTVDSENSLSVTKRNSKDGSANVFPFRFDRVLDENTSQQQVFNEVLQLIVSALDGFNVCVIAYGQTGSGKTFTMEGPEDQVGIIPRFFNVVFDLIRDRKDHGWEYNVEVSMVEIYNETILDLLNQHTECTIRISTTDQKKTETLHLENVTSISVTDQGEALKLFRQACNERKVATTKCNGRSSRSHFVIRVHVKAKNASTQAERESVLNLVDLAGSERVKQSEVEGIRFNETRKINYSLTQLLTVIMSLGSKAAHIPYRNSKLTHLLSTSLGNSAKALMLVHVSPAEIDVNETLNSLKFAQKVNDVLIGPRNETTRRKSQT